MKPENPGYQPAEAKSGSRELREPREDFETEFAEIQARERSWSLKVHEIIADKLKGGSRKEVPAWARAAFVLSALASAETAEAKDRALLLEEEVDVQSLLASDADLSHVYPNDDARALDRYVGFGEADVRGYLTIVSTDHKADARVSSEISLSELVAVSDGVGPLVIDGFVSSIELRQTLELAQLPDIHDGTWTFLTQDTDAPDEFFASKTYFDTYGNHVQTHIYKMAFEEENNGVITTALSDLMRVDKIQPIVDFEVDAKGKPGNVEALSFDLYKSGGRESFANRVFHSQPEARQRIVAGVPFSSFDAEPESLDVITEYQVSGLKRGLKNVNKLFGEPDNIKCVYLRQDTSANAAAHYNGSIEVNTGLFVKLADRPELVEEVMEHEMFHQRDFDLGLSISAELSALWLATPPAVLEEFSEENFSIGFGGHASDNVFEFTASWLNSLDDPEWYGIVMQMSSEAQAVNMATLKIVSQLLEANTDIQKGAPIHNLLKHHLELMGTGSVPERSTKLPDIL